MSDEKYHVWAYQVTTFDPDIGPEYHNPRCTRCGKPSNKKNWGTECSGLNWPMHPTCACNTYAYAPGEMPPPDAEGHHPSCPHWQDPPEPIPLTRKRIPAWTTHLFEDA